MGEVSCITRNRPNVCIIGLDWGENMSGADNQQERLRAGWIVGFVDGEGTFSVAIQRNAEMSLGWQVFPEFVVTQGAKSLGALEELKSYFGCGRIYRNHRYDNHNEDIFRYCVRKISDLDEKIVPFFKMNPLKTSKKDDFEKFVQVIELMKAKRQLTFDGLQVIAMIAQGMNSRRKSKFLVSSETVRQTLYTE
jgi:LAGLIDADG endonuclease